MGCEICGRSSCTRSYHSLEDQDNFDAIADNVKDRIKNQIQNRIDRLGYIEHENEIYIKLDDVSGIIYDAG